jgi:hypothetical protein
MNEPTTGQDEKATPPSDSSGARKPQGQLETMRRQLQDHSALEDLGPLFGPEAQRKI